VASLWSKCLAEYLRCYWSNGGKRLGFKGAAAIFGIFVIAGTAPSAPPALAQDKPLRISAFGDSLTAGYGLPASLSFPARLQAALQAKGRKIVIENAGVSGDTAQGGLDRLDWSIGDGIDGVIVELGANDALRGLDPVQTRQALDGIILRLKERRIPVMLAGMRAPVNMGPDFARRFDPIFKDLAEKHGLMLYPFFLDGVAAMRDLNQNDGIHPNAAGVEVIVARMLPMIELFLDSLKRPG
jgi:acyl-CoA thioesterase I